MSRTAVVIYNLGGPDSPEAVRPFLFNLFNDPFILRQIAPVRWFLAWLISTRRAPVAREIYRQIGGRSPILPETEKQAKALAEALGDPSNYRVFIAMRYWRPFAADCAGEVKSYDPDRIVLLPLYPQFSTTTTQSFLTVWNEAATRIGLKKPTATICCYPTDGGFISAIAGLVRAGLQAMKNTARPRVLFSAHGLPKKFIASGDPYQAQIEMTVAAVVDQLAIPDLDHVICYQSRVGPVEWLRPYTDDEIRRAGQDGIPILVVPVAFVSEHSETLVELDIEYARLAQECGVPEYRRVPAVGIEPSFIDGLARLVRAATTDSISAGDGQRVCPAICSACPIESPGNSAGV